MCRWSNVCIKHLVGMRVYVHASLVHVWVWSRTWQLISLTHVSIYIVMSYSYSHSAYGRGDCNSIFQFWNAQSWLATQNSDWPLSTQRSATAHTTPYYTWYIHGIVILHCDIKICMSNNYMYVVYMQWAGMALYFVLYRGLVSAGSCCTYIAT